MSWDQVVSAFVNDDTFKAVVVLVVLDIVLGVGASVKAGQFAFAKVVGFLRDDVLGKVLPWFAIYAAAKWAPDVSVLGVDMDAIQKVVFAAVVIALVGSLTSSIADLGLGNIGSKLPKALGTGERTPPPA